MKNIIFLLSFLTVNNFFAQKTVSSETLQSIYDEVKTPYKYGLVVAPADNFHKTDCPTVFRKNGKWYMSYLVYDGKSGKDGRGYETWLAESENLLEWKTLGRILQFADDQNRWDANQRAGYIALIDNVWGGTYEPRKFNGKYWLSYFGGQGRGYESGMLHEGIAFTDKDITTAHEWQTLDNHILSPTDKAVGWWENITQYKSSVFYDKSKKLGKPFVLFYNAGGINPANNVKAERIGIALSKDMKTWNRYAGNPVVNHEQGISGDAYIQKINDLYVMFYFGAFHRNKPYKAFNTFAASYDLVNWTDWTGEDLIFPTEKYDNLFAHKSCVIKWNGTVYHFYCAVNEDDQRGIAVATSKNLGKSLVRFPKAEKETFRKEIPLNEDWETKLTPLPAPPQKGGNSHIPNFEETTNAPFSPSIGGGWGE
ncbi:MAG: beta-galactosidase, partial [Paludibacter sp.]|nr:beta-galactosidase [Paludibacter sp.]